MTLAEPLHITRIVAQVFTSLGIRYCIGGSLASSLHGIPRATHDVDIVADIMNRHIPDLVKAFEKAFYIDAEMIREAVHYQRSFNLLHLETLFKVDVFILKPDALSQEEMSRRRQYQVSDDSQDTLFLTSAEDIIVNKLVWHKLGGKVSERQWTDVQGVLQIQHQNLDLGYLERAAAERNVLRLLRKAMKESQEKTKG